MFLCNLVSHVMNVYNEKRLNLWRKYLFPFCISSSRIAFDILCLYSPFSPHLPDLPPLLYLHKRFFFLFQSINQVQFTLFKYSWVCGFPLECGSYTLKEIWPSFSQQLSISSSSITGVEASCSLPFSGVGLCVHLFSLFWDYFCLEFAQVLCMLSSCSESMYAHALLNQDKSVQSSSEKLCFYFYLFFIYILIFYSFISFFIFICFYCY